jgi:hypothetical protein
VFEVLLALKAVETVFVCCRIMTRSNGATSDLETIPETIFLVNAAEDLFHTSFEAKIFIFCH